MNCANHPDRERSAFCQNCGKPLCTDCVRNVGTSVFCEPCLVARVAGAAAPGYGYTGATVYPSYPPYPSRPGGYPPVGNGEPNPKLAGFLGLIPGVGAMYNEQYAKGIVHLIVFAILVSLASDFNGIFGLFVAGWIIYMAFEANRTARARRDGTPLPNPFGLNDLSERLGFGKAWPSGNRSGSSPYPNATPGTPSQPSPDPNIPPAHPYGPPYSYVPPVSQWGAPQDASSYGVPVVPPVPPAAPTPGYVDPNVPYYRRFPAGAIWLIVLGVFFLVGNSGIFHIHARFLGPILLIGIGVWIFVHRMTSSGAGIENDGTPFYQWRLARAVRNSVWTVLTGFIWLLDVLHILPWSRSWPIFLIAAGVMIFLNRTLYGGYGAHPPTSDGGYPYTEPPTPPVTTTDLVPSATHDDPGSSAGGGPRSDSEGR